MKATWADRVLLAAGLMLAGCDDQVIQVVVPADSATEAGSDTASEDTRQQAASEVPDTSGCSETVFDEAGDMAFEGFDTGIWATTEWLIYRNGSIVGVHTFANEDTLTVVARGEKAGTQWPHMVVWVGTTQVGNTFVESAVHTAYTFPVDGITGHQEIRIELDNDLIVGDEDVNLFVDSVTIGCSAP